MRYARRGGAERPARGLTPRQREIAALVAQGYDNRRIADALRSTPGTISTHLQSIRARLRVRGRDEIAAWAHRHEVGKRG